jgi:hypothetical protein
MDFKIIQDPPGICIQSFNWHSKLTVKMSIGSASQNLPFLALHILDKTDDGHVYPFNLCKEVSSGHGVSAELFFAQG